MSACPIDVLRTVASSVWVAKCRLLTAAMCASRLRTVRGGAWLRGCCMDKLRVLVACEESQVVTKAFRSLGHIAFSCDLQDCSGGHPEWHIKGDCLPLLSADWDLVIAHPPCTYLAKSGATRLFPGGVLDADRYCKLLDARKFFLEIFNSPVKRLCIENPIPFHIADLPLASQYIEPYMFGDPYCKATYLWLRGLPLLMADDLRYDFKPYINGVFNGKAVKSPKLRSKTFPGVARAMAYQWSRHILGGVSPG